MKILFITDNFPPELNAPAARTFEHTKIWVEAGVEVTVLTCFPNFPAGKLYPGYRQRLWQVESIDGVRVIRLPSYITANEGFLRRVLDYLSFACSAFVAGLFIRTDLIVATSPQFFTTWAGYALSLLKRRPWIFELRDLWPESIRTVGAMEEGRLYRLLERIELFLYRRATRVVAVTEAFRQNLISRGIDAEKIDVVTNGANLEIYSPRPKDPALISELGLEGRFLVGYIGTHGLAHGLDFILDQADQLRRLHPGLPLSFLFVGAGAAKAALLEQRQRLALDQLLFFDPVDKEEVARYLSILDICLVPLRKSDTFLAVIPSKIFEAAAMERPLLLGVDGEARRIVEEHGFGLYFEPENGESFRAALMRLYEDRSLYQQLQRQGRQLAAAYDRNQLAGKMLDLMRRCVATSK